MSICRLLLTLCDRSDKQQSLHAQSSKFNALTIIQLSAYNAEMEKQTKMKAELIKAGVQTCLSLHSKQDSSSCTSSIPRGYSRRVSERGK